DLVLTYPQFAVCAKRGHDRKTPIWVVGLFFAINAAFDLLLLAGFVTQGDMKSPLPTLAVVFAIPFLVLALALIIDLGFRRGTIGPTRYGPDPLDAIPSGPSNSRNNCTVSDGLQSLLRPPRVIPDAQRRLYCRDVAPLGASDRRALSGLKPSLGLPRAHRYG